jgi:hypothetical protein
MHFKLLGGKQPSPKPVKGKKTVKIKAEINEVV